MADRDQITGRLKPRESRAGRPAVPPIRLIHTKRAISAERALATRLLLVLGLILLAILVNWIDRDGLVDHSDGDISFSDVVYFTIITVTTVGYGDIVPVTQQARLFDALVVTPIRIFIWLIFLGTAYQFIIRKVWEDIRMAAIQRGIRDHVIICGFGHSGQVAARELIAQGHDPESIVVLDQDESCVRAAVQLGVIGVHGDATNDPILEAAKVRHAKALIACAGRDDTNLLIVLSVRNIAKNIKIIANIRQNDNVKLVRQAGADVIVTPNQFGGYLLADSVRSSHLAEYVFDLMSSRGRVSLIERKARLNEVGNNAREIADGLVVRIYRNGQAIGFWEDGCSQIEAGDDLLIIQPTGEKEEVLNPVYEEDDE